MDFQIATDSVSQSMTRSPNLLSRSSMSKPRMSDSNVSKSPPPNSTLNSEGSKVFPAKQNSFDKKIPFLSEPVSMKMRLFPGYYYLLVKKPYQGKADFNKKRYFETTNTLHRDIHFFMKMSSENIVNQIERENQLNLKTKGTTQSKKSSKRFTKVLVFNPSTRKIESMRKSKAKPDFKFEQMLEDDVDNQTILRELGEEEPPFGHYLLLEFDENHLVTKIEYMGRDEPHLGTFQNLFGLHRTFFNLMFERRDAGLLDDFVEFITSEWEHLLSHPLFTRFRLQANQIFQLAFENFQMKKNYREELFSEVLRSIAERVKPKPEHQEKGPGSQATAKDSPRVQNGPQAKAQPSPSELAEKKSISEASSNSKVNSKESKGHKLETEDKENVDLSRSKLKKEENDLKIFLKDDQVYIDIINSMDKPFVKKMAIVIEKCIKNYKDLFDFTKKSKLD